MNWIEVEIRTTRDGAAALEALLEATGAVSVTLIDAEDEPLFEPGVGETPLWNQLVLTGLYPQGTDAKFLHATLSEAWAPAPLPSLRITELPEQNWVRAWLDDFRPMRFGARLWVCPSWWLAEDGDELWTPPASDAAEWEGRNSELLRAMQEEGNVVLRLDPGLAFGTGTHPTTSLCLQWLDAQDLAGLTLVDYGCGSGILGIAALLLGTPLVHGIDNDPQALQATLDNCRKNRLDPLRFPLYLPNAFAQELAAGRVTAVDGVMADILAGTLIQLCELLAMQVKRGGWILMSGILRAQADAVIAAYAEWFRGFEVAGEGDWVRISAVRS